MGKREQQGIKKREQVSMRKGNVGKEGGQTERVSWKKSMVRKGEGMGKESGFSWLSPRPFALFPPCLTFFRVNVNDRGKLIERVVLNDVLMGEGDIEVSI